MIYNAINNTNNKEKEKQRGVRERKSQFDSFFNEILMYKNIRNPETIAIMMMIEILKIKIMIYPTVMI
jgi:hypothetical protein